MTLNELRDRLRVFTAERDWEQYHTPRNLALALGGEVGELMELFQWRTDAEVMALVGRTEGRSAVSDELADVLMYIVRLADVLDIDLGSATERKMNENERRYEAARVRGSADKQP